MLDPIMTEKSLNWQVEHREVREESRGLTKTRPQWMLSVMLK